MDNSSTKEWPGAFGIYKRSKEAVLVNIWPLITAFVVYIAASIVTSIILSIFDLEETLVSDLVGLLLSSALTVSMTLLILAGIRNKKMEFSPALKASVSILTLKMALLSILSALILVGSLLLFIVPFFFILPRIALAPYFLIDKKLGVFDSISASWNATRGSLGKIWGVIGVSVLFAIAIVVLVGIYLSIMYAAAFGLLYLHLAAKTPANASAEEK